MYVREDGTVVTDEERYATMMLIKILYRLQLIEEEQAMKIATQFHILYV
jgi:hypothetical protein